MHNLPTRAPVVPDRATALDPRLIAPGLAVTVADLVAVFIDHQPGQATTCGRCGHRYTTAAPLCPSLTLARTLLKTRRHEDPSAAEPIVKALDARDTRSLPAPDPVPPTYTDVPLFPVTPAMQREGRAA